MTDDLITNSTYNLVGCTIQRGIQDMMYSCDGTISGDGTRTTDGSNMPSPLTFPTKFVPFTIKNGSQCLFYGFVPKFDHNIHASLNYGSFTGVSNEWYLSHQKVPTDIRTTVLATNPSTYIGQLVGGAGFVTKTSTASNTLQRYGHSMVEFGGSLYIYGGTSSAGVTNHIFKSTDRGATWVPQSPTSEFTARTLFGCCVIGGTGNQRVVIAGGVNGSTYLNTVYVSSDGVNFTAVTQTTPFSARSDFAMIPLSNTKILISGGNVGGTVANDWLVASIYDSASDTTTPASWVAATLASGDPSTTFVARKGHRATMCGTSPYVGRAWIIGGDNGASTPVYYNDVWEVYLDGSNLHIHRVKTNAEFSARSRACVVSFNNTVFVMFGETVTTTYAGDAWMCSNLPTTPLTHGASYVEANAPVFTCVYSSLMVRGVMAASCTGVLGAYMSLGRGVTYLSTGAFSAFTYNTDVKVIDEGHSPTGMRIGRIDNVSWLTTGVTSPSVQQKQFVFDSNNTRQQCIDEICAYCHFVQLTFLLDVDGTDDWQTYFYFIQEDMIATLEGSAGGVQYPIALPIKVYKNTIPTPAPVGAILGTNVADEDGITINKDYTETINRVHVAAVDPTTGIWYHAYKEHADVTAGTMIPIDYYWETSDIVPISTAATQSDALRNAWVAAKCLTLYNYFNTDNITMTMQFKDQTTFQLYQQMTFYEYSSSIPTAAMRISDIKYDYAMGSWMTTLTLAYDQKMSDRRMLARLIGNDFYNEQQDMKDDVFVDLTKISVGLVVTSPVTDGGRRSCNVKLDKDGTIVKCWLLN